ncbi:BspA family leucine-rich repeat surface protein [Candidatus Saccharibacteria bacterium]|nr:BspA family leucine-rich repeat surface protein [Candidatus Saccharibacteria bacterium]
MKKQGILSVVVALMLPFIFVASANAASNILKITNVTLGEKSATTEAEITSFDDETVDANIKFHARYDYATLNFTVENPTQNPYKLLQIEVTNTNPYVEYQFDNHANTTINPGDSLNFSLMAIYTNLVTDLSQRTQNAPATINFILENLSTGEETTNDVTIVPNTSTEPESTIVPDTGQNTKNLDGATQFTITFAILAGLVSIFGLIAVKIKRRKLATTCLGLAVAFITMIPLTANIRALTIVASNITVEPTVKLYDKIALSYTDEDGNVQQKVVDWNQPGGTMMDPEEKEGHNFSKWTYQDGTDYNPTTTVTDDLTLVPIYTPISYYINLIANGGAYEDEVLNATYDTPLMLPANYFTNEDLVFTGWNTESDYSGTHYDDEAEVKNLTTVDGATVNLYAEWGKENYSVYFEPNYYDLESTYPYFYIGMNSTSYLEAHSNETFTLPKGEFYGNQGYRFLGWNTEADGSGTHYDDEAEVKNLTHEDEIYLYAEWERIESTLITGPEINAILKTLVGTDTGMYFDNYWETPEDFSNKYNIAESGAPVYLWRDDNNIYWWSEAVPRLNADSSHMFEDMPFSYPNFYYLDTSNVVSFESAFENSATEYIGYNDYESMDISSLENASYMFAGSNINGNSLSEHMYDFSSVTNAYGMFEGCENLTYFSASFGNLENGGNMFKDSAVQDIWTSSLVTESTTNISGMFENTPDLTTIDFSDWNTSNVTDMSNLFKNTGIENFNIHTAENWSTSNVTDMSGMFENTKAEILDLSTFDTSKVTNMDRMFWEAEGDAHLTGIYVSENFVVNAYNETDEQSMFNNNNLLVGDNGTTYSSDHCQKDYAHIDKTNNPGYLSDVHNKPTCHIRFNTSWHGTENEAIMPTLFVPGGRDFTLPANQFENPGFVFLGWGRWYNDTNILQDQATIAIPEGENNTIELYAKWRPVTFEEAFETAGLNTVTIDGQEYYKMQDMTPELCASVGFDSNNTVQTQMVDTRDNKLYWIAKIRDGNCWMTQNLDLDLNSDRTLTPTDSDVKTNWTPTTTYNMATQNSYIAAQELNLPQSFDPGNIYFDSTSRAARNPATCNLLDINNCSAESKFASEPFETNGTHGHVGNYYNWLAAIASDNYDDYYQYDGNTHTEASIPDTSICPKGWRLPTSTYYKDTTNTVAGKDEYYNVVYWDWHYDINGTYGADWPIIREPFYAVPGDLLSVSSTNGESTLVLTAGRATRWWTNVPAANNTAVSTYISSTDHSTGTNGFWTKIGIKSAVPVRCIAR